MKKFISGLIAAFVLSAGFVAVSAETASAACKPSQYVQCQSTSTKVTPAPKTIKAGKAAKLKVSVKSRGNVKPSGKFTITVKGPGGYKKVISVTAGSGTKTINLGKLKKPGKYKVTVAFKGGNGFYDSKSTTTITVKKK
jgi:Big-like domain-containing protein